ncbi:MAG: hydrogenase iron-sulfur subunit [Anaerolineales bacterium]|nr:MAG: hydrogenase iron-sulfur subunit [Anaerolineales bacterium]
MSKNETFTPEITLFTCIYCGYMAADTAGALRQEYPADVKIVRLPCTGKIDMQYMLDAFDEGADGVMIVACSLGNCHHERGNERARARVQRTQTILESVGFEPERVEIHYVSGGMGATFAECVREMTSRLQELGPNPLKGNIQFSTTELKTKPV